MWVGGRREGVDVFHLVDYQNPPLFSSLSALSLILKGSYLTYRRCKVPQKSRVLMRAKFEFALRFTLVGSNEFIINVGIFWEINHSERARRETG